MPDRWQGLDAEAGALLEALGCDTGRGEHEDVAAALRRAFEAGFAAGANATLDAAYERAAPIRALPLPSPDREEPSR